MEIREMVREEMAKYVLGESHRNPEGVLEEGFGTSLVRALGTIGAGAAAAGLSTVAYIPAASSLWTMAKVAGSIPALAALVSPMSFVVGSIASGTIAALFTWTAMGIGYDVASWATGLNSTIAAKDLKKVIKQRDDLIAKIAREKGVEKTLKEAKRQQRKLDVLSIKQVEIASSLKQHAKRDYADDKITKEDFNALMKIGDAGEKGVLSYLAKNR